MKPSLPRFIYFTTEHGQYILCTEYPFIIGQVWKYTNEKDFANKTVDCAPNAKWVDGYYVLIARIGNLSGLKHADLTDVTLTEMSSFFLSKINERPMGWRRYLIEKV